MPRSEQTAHRWTLPLVLGALALVLQIAGGPETWRLERELIASQPWRLLSAHLVHLGWTHLALNLAGLAVLWALLASVMPPRHWAVLMLACGAGTTLGLLAFSPEVAW